MLKVLIDVLKLILQASSQATPAKSKPSETVSPPSNPPKSSLDTGSVDWSNMSAKISKYFTVKDALWLPSWSVAHVPSEEEKANILRVAKKLDIVREFLNEPLTVHVWMRPGQVNAPGTEWHGKDYNTYVYETFVWKGLTAEQKANKVAPNSPHKNGDAVDFSVQGKRTPKDCNNYRAKLVPKLEEWDVRLENNKDGNWLHIDVRPVKNSRFFNP